MDDGFTWPEPENKCAPDYTLKNAGYASLALAGTAAAAGAIFYPDATKNLLGLESTNAESDADDNSQLYAIGGCVSTLVLGGLWWFWPTISGWVWGSPDNANGDVDGKAKGDAGDDTNRAVEEPTPASTCTDASGGNDSAAAGSSTVDGAQDGFEQEQLPKTEQQAPPQADEPQGDASTGQTAKKKLTKEDLAKYYGEVGAFSTMAAKADDTILNQAVKDLDKECTQFGAGPGTEGYKEMLKVMSEQKARDLKDGALKHLEERAIWRALQKKTEH